PAGVAFDTALRHLRANPEKARDFLDGFRRRVNEALENEFCEEVVVRKKVKRKYAEPFKAHIFAYTDLWKRLLNTSGSLPPIQVHVHESGPGPRAPRYMFRYRRDAWEVNYETDPVLVPDTKGMFYLKILLQNPNRLISASKLVAIVGWELARLVWPSTQGIAT